ncbi:hypothetical protein [Kyrpidia spormannii]|uniref:hypothetical protein n=1 Tax=Kyrpidia spormannii TaxID=2055160 RepID=UPI0012FFD779|nr:hypothetical protein [Kyrpidia spormannii]
MRFGTIVLIADVVLAFVAAGYAGVLKSELKKLIPKGEQVSGGGKNGGRIF